MSKSSPSHYSIIEAKFLEDWHTAFGVALAMGVMFYSMSLFLDRISSSEHAFINHYSVLTETPPLRKPKSAL